MKRSLGERFEQRRVAPMRHRVNWTNRPAPEAGREALPSFDGRHFVVRLVLSILFLGSSLPAFTQTAISPIKPPPPGAIQGPIQGPDEPDRHREELIRLCRERVQQQWDQQLEYCNSMQDPQTRQGCVDHTNEVFLQRMEDCKNTYQ